VSEQNVELIRSIYSAWERGDFSSVEWADPEIEFTIPGPDLKVHRGLEALSDAWGEWLREFDEFSILGREFYDAGDRVVVDQLFRGTGKRSRIPIADIPAGAVLTVLDGKVTRFEGYITLEEALASAGLDS
jgi:ketosteroid isomerase-like protein